MTVAARLILSRGMTGTQASAVLREVLRDWVPDLDVSVTTEEDGTRVAVTQEWPDAGQGCADVLNTVLAACQSAGHPPPVFLWVGEEA